MTEKNTYWIADIDGNRALVEGADERDRWTRLHGWTEVSEPGPQDFVWLRHEGLDGDDGHGGRQRFVAESMPLWEARGWKPSAPPEPVNLALPDAGRPAPAPAAESPAITTKTAAKATSGDTKEK